MTTQRRRQAWTAQELAEVHADLSYCRWLLERVRDAMPGHLEQQQQAVIDGVRGADAALLWVGAQRKRVTGQRVTPKGTQRSISVSTASGGGPVIEIRCGPREWHVRELHVRDFHIGIERID